MASPSPSPSPSLPPRVVEGECAESPAIEGVAVVDLFSEPSPAE